MNCTIINFSRITDDLAETIPNLESLVLTGNNIQELGEIDALSKLQKFIALSLLTNPVTSKKYYREYVIFKYVNNNFIKKNINNF